MFKAKSFFILILIFATLVVPFSSFANVIFDEKLTAPLHIQYVEPKEGTEMTVAITNDGTNNANYKVDVTVEGIGIGGEGIPKQTKSVTVKSSNTGTLTFTGLLAKVRFTITVSGKKLDASGNPTIWGSEIGPLSLIDNRSSSASTTLTIDKDNGGLVPCGNEVYSQYTYKTYDKKTGDIIAINGPFDKKKEKLLSDEADISGQAVNPCGFDHLMILINKTINFILIDLAVPIAAIMFVYAGFLLLTSGGESGKKTTAKKIFTNVAIGLIIVAVAWLAVQLLLSLLGYDGAWLGF
jgi:hypothetical protein